MLNRPKFAWSQSIWIVTGICGLLLAVHLFLRTRNDQMNEGLDVVALGLIAVGLSPWIARVLESFKLGSVEFKFVKQQIEDQKQDIESRKFLFMGFVSEYELQHLRKLQSGQKFIRDVEDYADEFKRQLRRLRDLGLIAHHSAKGVGAMYNDPGRYKDVHAYFYITQRGRTYLRLRESMMGQASNTAN